MLQRRWEWMVWLVRESRLRRRGVEVVEVLQQSRDVGMVVETLLQRRGLQNWGVMG